jgi:ribonuclease D
MSIRRRMSYQLFESDVSSSFLDAASGAGIVAWDIETSGLDWRSDLIATCQIQIPQAKTAKIRIGTTTPRRLVELLLNPAVKKIFHHAMFDLRFMSYRWNVVPQTIACTKIAAKILDGESTESHSLKVLVERHLGIMLDKTEQTSNWLAPHLTTNQLEYAARDVIYLASLLEVLEQRLRNRALLSLAHACFSHIPTRVQLDILGYGDIYMY